jgi:hypothetical protein
VDGDEGGGAGVHRRHFFKHQRGVEPGQGEAAGGFGRIQAAKAQLARLGDGLFGEDALGVPVRGVRGQLGQGKVAGGLGKGALFFGQFKVHGVVSCVGGALGEWGVKASGLAGLSLLSQRIMPWRRSCVSRVRHSW